MRNNIISFIVGFLLATLISIATAATLGTRNDNEISKFVLNDNDEICVRITTTD